MIVYLIASSCEWNNLDEEAEIHVQAFVGSDRLIHVLTTPSRAFFHHLVSCLFANSSNWILLNGKNNLQSLRN